MRHNKSSFTSLLLAGAAAYAYYRYSKMTPQERQSFVGNLKQKGRDLFEQYMPSGSRNSNPTAAANERFGEGNDYTA